MPYRYTAFRIVTLLYFTLPYQYINCTLTPHYLTFRHQYNTSSLHYLYVKQHNSTGLHSTKTKLNDTLHLLTLTLHCITELHTYLIKQHLTMLYINLSLTQLNCTLQLQYDTLHYQSYTKTLLYITALHKNITLPHSTKLNFTLPIPHKTETYQTIPNLCFTENYLTLPNNSLLYYTSPYHSSKYISYSTIYNPYKTTLNLAFNQLCLDLLHFFTKHFFLKSLIDSKLSIHHCTALCSTVPLLNEVIHCPTVPNHCTVLN